MCSITVISSFHKNYGKCNPDELLKIIEHLQPEVIFEELDIDYFNWIYADGNSPSSNEAIAIIRYLKKYPTNHIPVDTYQFEYSELFDGGDVIGRRNPEYYNLWSQHLSKISRHGYTYLNSNDCLNIVNRLKVLELNTLAEINDEKLSSSYKTELIIYEKREFEMLRNIYDYCKESPFDKGIFICGIDHRKGLNKIIREFESNENIKLNWRFFNTTSNGRLE